MDIGHRELIVWLDHLPEILHHEDYQAQDGCDVQTRLEEKFGDKYEKRVLRIIVQVQLDRIDSLKNGTDTYNVFRDVFGCYRWLYEKCGIMHRGISHSNVMCRYSKKKGRIVGVLNDFDLTSWLAKMGLEPTSKQRTGTKPFMAIDLLKPNPPQPIYRHDLESLFHVMVWHAHRYQDGKLVDDPPFEDWARGTFDVAFKSKTSFILSGNIDPTPQHKPLYDVLFDSQRALARGIVQTRAQRETSPDGSRRIVLPTEEEMLTLCGNFSFEIVETLFKEYDPMRVVVSK